MKGQLYVRLATSDKFQADIFVLRVVNFTLLCCLVAERYCRLFLFCCGNFKVHYLQSSHHRKRRFPLKLLFSAFLVWKVAMLNCFMSAIVHVYRKASECKSLN